jgi:glycosyltransferase involved in cell wall biosynthesis
MKKILFVCGSPPHPTHKLFAESVGADFYYCGSGGVKEVFSKLLKMPREYDIYFTEGLFTFAVLSKWIGRIKKSSKIVNLFSDPRLYQIINNIKFNSRSLKLKKYNFLKKFFIKCFIKKVDGAICVGKYERSLLEKVNPVVPTKVVYPLIDRGEFFNTSVRMDKNNITFIGNGPDYYYKGVDYILELFEKVKSEVPKTELFIIGKDWENYQKNVIVPEGINFLGKKNAKEIISFFEKSSLYCHFGRGEAFGVTVLEAMATGLPVILSNETGAKEVVNQVDKNYIVEIEDIEGTVSKIVNYLKKSKQDKIKISKQFKKIAESYQKRDLIKLFKSEFNQLVKELYKDEN